ncbi:hypothetical protein M2T82_08850 [Elizabethkingia ursingii]|nr:hypothetical protein [Elizabethkingia ursingii]MCL1668166.1 hypothetical protein [Elizabethkingia ursingii]
MATSFAQQGAKVLATDIQAEKLTPMSEVFLSNTAYKEDFFSIIPMKANM